MDNFVIVILGLIFFIGRTYMNYKKEQEEAQKRNPSAPRPTKAQPPTRTSNRPTQRPDEGIPKWLEEFFPSQPAAPQPRPVPRTPVQTEAAPKPVLFKKKKVEHVPATYERVKYVPSESPADLLKEYRNLPDKQDIEELKRSVAIHKKHKHEFVRLDPFVVVDAQDGINVPDFDLRQAIIMKAILDRPYAN